MADTNNLVILTFEGVGSAAVAYKEIEELEEQKLLELKDAIIIERDETVGTMIVSPSTGGSTPGSSGMPASTPDDSFRVVQTHKKRGKYARRGGGIGFLAGFLLGGPVGGLVVGASIGAITAAMKDFGIDDNNIAVIKARLQPNTSALMLLGHVEDRDAFLDKLRGYEPQVVSSSLTPEVEKQLREALGSA